VTGTEFLEASPYTAGSAALAVAERPQTPVRVCFLIDDLARAGTESQLLALIRHLDRTRVLPFLCLLKGEGELSRSLEPDDCPVLRLGVRSLRSPATLPRALRLARFLRRHRIDVLQTYFADSTYLGVLVARLAGVRRVVRTRNNLGYWMTRTDRWLGRLCTRLADATIANCEACRQAVIRDEAAAPASVVVLPNGVDFARFCEIPSPDAQTGPRCVGAVANLRPVKAIGDLIRAAADVPDVTFRVAGEGESRPELERQVKELGLEGRFFLCGAVTDTPGFLAGLDVAVLCSRSEGMSNALLEYMAAGRPIVATAVGANGELVRDGVSGLLVPPGEPALLARAIRRLVTDPDLAKRLGTAAREKAARQHSLESRARRFEEFYRGLVQTKPLAA
jgi:glycosyltransferase involved in cell wall biosynthesis